TRLRTWWSGVRISPGAPFKSLMWLQKMARFVPFFVHFLSKIGTLSIDGTTVGNGTFASSYAKRLSLDLMCQRCITGDFNMTAQHEAKKFLSTLEALLKETDKNIPALHLVFLLRVYLSGDGGTSHEDFLRLGFSASVASRLMQDFTKVRYDKRTPGYDMISVEHDPMNLRRKIIRMNPRGQRVVERILGTG
ncbi:MAG TPA: hypothetical protein VFH52_07275, partial [Rhodanobacteraceae bacterium]|nr:hypothetical protein [Rhodanobacteraceae bacterium]